MVRGFLQTFTLAIMCVTLMSAHSCDRGSTTKAAMDINAGDSVLSCNIDADCTVVKDGCCGCNQSGKQRAIAANAVDAWLSKLSSECNGTVCAQVMSRDPTCAQKAACVQGRCELQ